MPQSLNILDFGAKGDGKSLCTDAINDAIMAAPKGATLILPKGHFLSFSIRLRSDLTLWLEEGCVLEAADQARHDGAYDPFEPNLHDLYQDFGHSHWNNSLICGRDIERTTIKGRGRIDGKGLTREGPGSRWQAQNGEFPLSMRDLSPQALLALCPPRDQMMGLGNKSIALLRAKQCAIQGISLVNGGHFAILATGCQDLSLLDLTIDTNRDGIDIDACQRVLIQGCHVNTPNDDAIVLKSSLALGEAIATRDVRIEDCSVSGFDLGTMIDGSRLRTQTHAPDQDPVTGRIKIGTESNGDFSNIRIKNCRFERSRGLALETVDGGAINDVVIEDIEMTEVTSAPIFLRLGARLRGPKGTSAGAIDGVVIRRLKAQQIAAPYCAMIMGLEDHPIKNVTLEDIELHYQGGGKAMTRIDPFDDRPDAYPEPSMFGITPASGLWARHVKALGLERVTYWHASPDERPPLIIET